MISTASGGYEDESPHRKGLSVTTEQVHKLLTKYLLQRRGNYNNDVEDPNAHVLKQNFQHYLESQLRGAEQSSTSAAPTVSGAATFDLSSLQLRAIKRGFNNKVYKVCVNYCYNKSSNNNDNSQQQQHSSSELVVVPMSFALRLSSNKTWSKDKVSYEVASMLYVAHYASMDAIPVPKLFAWSHPDPDLQEPQEPQDGCSATEWSFILMEWKDGHVLTAKLWNEILVTGSNSSTAKNTSSNEEDEDELSAAGEEDDDDDDDSKDNEPLDESALSPEARKRRATLVSSIVRCFRQLSLLPTTCAGSTQVGSVAKFDSKCGTLELGPSLEIMKNAPHLACEDNNYQSAFKKAMAVCDYYCYRLRLHSQMPESKGKLDPLLALIQPIKEFGATLEALYDKCPVVAVHGDLCGRNLLVDPTTGALTAVLDWEWLEINSQHVELQLGLDDIPKDLRQRILLEGGLAAADEEDRSNSSNNAARPLFLQPGVQQIKSILRFENMCDALSPWTIAAHYDAIREAKETNDDSFSWPCNVDEEVADSVQKLTQWVLQGKPTESEFKVDEIVSLYHLQHTNQRLDK